MHTKIPAPVKKKPVRGKQRDSMEELIEKNEEAVVETPKGLAAMRARMKERKPDTDWDATDDDAMAEMAMADYDEMSSIVDQYKQRDAAFDELAAKHPQGMMFLAQLAKGKSMREAIENSMEVSIEDLYNDPDYPRAKEEKAAKEAEAVKNMLAEIDKQAEENGWTPEDVDQALEDFDELIRAVEENKVTFAMLSMLRNGKNYEKDLAGARHEGEVSGRNAKIEQGQRKKKASTDGLPALGGMSGGGNKTITRNAKAGLGSGIWEAANMKRNNY